MLKTGIVKFYNDVKGFGFIVDQDSGRDVFFHATGIVNKQKIYKDDLVEFEETPGDRGTLAKKVSKVG